MMSLLADRRRLLRTLLTIAVTVVLLYLVIRVMSPAQLKKTLAEISPIWLLPAALAAFLFILSRAWRYALLLSTDRRSFGSLLAITLTAWGAGLLLPGPSSDAAFVVLARTRLRTPIAVGTGAALLSRLLDVLSLLLIALITASLAGVHLPQIVLVGGLVIAAVIALALTGLFWARSRGWIVGGLERLPLPSTLHQRLHGAIEELGSGSRPFLLVVSTVSARVATGFQYLALFAAVHPLSYVQVWFALSIRTLLIAVPVQGLGGLGTTQLWWTVGLTLLGFRTGQALAISLAVHLLDLCVSLPQAAAGWLVVMTRPAPPAEEPAVLRGVSAGSD